jgi:hypothetical protein
MSFNDDYWLWTQDTSSRSNAITLIHGVLGHRALLFEELIPCKFYLSFIELFLSLSISLKWEGTCIGIFNDFLFLAMSSAENHSLRVFHPKPSYLKPSILVSLSCMPRISYSIFPDFGDLGRLLPDLVRK